MDKCFGGAGGWVDEVDVGWIAARGVYGKNDEGLFENLRDAVDGGLFEEDELSGAEFEGFVVAEEELCAPGEDEKVLVAGGVIVGGDGGVDAEDAGAGVGFIGEARVDEHGGGGGGKVAGDGLKIEGGGVG